MYENETLNISVGFYFRKLVEVDEKQQFITIIAYISSSWKDSYLTWDPNDSLDIDQMYMPVGEIWEADFLSAYRIEDMKDPDAYTPWRGVTSDGYVTADQLVRLKVSCAMDMTFYPFDKHSCAINFTNWFYTKKEVSYVNTSATFNFLFTENVGFNIKDVKAEVMDKDSNGTAWQMAAIVVWFERRPTSVVSTILIPVSLLSLISCLPNLLPPDADSRAELQVSIMLSFSVMMLLIGDHLPPSEKWTRLGLCLSVMMAANVFALFCGILVLRLMKLTHHRPSPSLLQIMTLIGRILLYKVPDNLAEVMPKFTKVEDTKEAGENKAHKIVEVKEASITQCTSSPDDGMKSMLLVIAAQVVEAKEQETCKMLWIYIGSIIDRCIFLLLLVIALTVNLAMYSTP